MTRITVIDVFKAKGLEPEPKLTWAVGAAVRDRFVDRYGRLPAKELRAKASGRGSHCFAVYPEAFRGVIEDAINVVTKGAPRGPDLFGGAL